MVIVIVHYEIKSEFLRNCIMFKNINEGYIHKFFINKNIKIISNIFYESNKNYITFYEKHKTNFIDYIKEVNPNIIIIYRYSSYSQNLRNICNILNIKLVLFYHGVIRDHPISLKFSEKRLNMGLDARIHYSYEELGYFKKYNYNISKTYIIGSLPSIEYKYLYLNNLNNNIKNYILNKHNIIYNECTKFILFIHSCSDIDGVNEYIYIINLLINFININNLVNYKIIIKLRGSGCSCNFNNDNIKKLHKNDNINIIKGDFLLSELFYCSDIVIVENHTTAILESYIDNYKTIIWVRGTNINYYNIGLIPYDKLLITNSDEKLYYYLNLFITNENLIIDDIYKSQINNLISLHFPNKFNGLNTFNKIISLYL